MEKFITLTVSRDHGNEHIMINFDDDTNTLRVNPDHIAFVVACRMLGDLVTIHMDTGESFTPDEHWPQIVEMIEMSTGRKSWR